MSFLVNCLSVIIFAIRKTLYRRRYYKQKSFLNENFQEANFITPKKAQAAPEDAACANNRNMENREAQGA